MGLSGNSYFDFFKQEDVKKDIRDLLSPLVNIIYNELYVYIWSICFFQILLFILVLANLIMLLRVFSYIQRNTMTKL
jgi:hypothetical protein